MLGSDIMSKQLKIKSGFILKNIAGDYIVVPSGKNIVDFKIMLTLNETGAWLWEQMEQGIETDTLTENFAEKYNIILSDAKNDIADFILQLNGRNLLE